MHKKTKMILHKISFVLFLCLSCCLGQEVLEVHPDAGLRVPELVTKYGYPLETHTVQTKDDYILTMHRIPHGKTNEKGTNKPVVFLMHGLLSSSADWVVLGPNSALGYLLADMGYDVWMGNARGNYYSRNHTKWDAKSDKKKFWNFSWHEIGSIDVPTMIDYILETTSEEKIFYIGHSQGGTTFFVMTTTRPEYNDKIRLMVALGPAVYMGDTPSLFLRTISQVGNSLGWLTKFVGLYEFLPSSNFIREISSLVCSNEPIGQELCSNLLFLIGGFDEEQLNKTMIPVFISNAPAGASTRQFVHYGQGIKSKIFRQFDYGLRNLKHYGRLTPPKYDISKVTAPVALFSGKNDHLISLNDIDKLHADLPRSVLNYKIAYEKFTHIDFIWAMDVVELLYNKIFDIMERF